MFGTQLLLRPSPTLDADTPLAKSSFGRRQCQIQDNPLPYAPTHRQCDGTEAVGLWDPNNAPLLCLFFLFRLASVRKVSKTCDIVTCGTRPIHAFVTLTSHSPVQDAIAACGA